MTWITELRQRLAAQLETIAPTHSDVPALLDLPAIIITEAAPFIEPASWGSCDVGFKATYYTRPGDSDVMIADADTFAAKLLRLPLSAAVRIDAYQAVTLADGQPIYTASALITINQEI